MEEVFRLDSSTEKRIFCREWKENDINYKGIIQIVHGMYESSENYSEFATFLAKNGYIVIAHDQLGHGKTIQQFSEFGHFTDEDGWEFLIKDICIVKDYIKNKYPNLSYILLGHSMGSILIRTYISNCNDKIDKIILSGTPCKKRGILPGILLIKIMKCIFGKKYKSKLVEYLVTGSFNDKYLENNLSESNNEIKEDLSYKNFTLQAYEDMLKGIRFISKKKTVKSSLKVPILIISGDQDPVGGYAKGILNTYNMFQKANDKTKIRLIKDAEHNILTNEGKEYAFYVILKWIEK